MPPERHRHTRKRRAAVTPGEPHVYAARAKLIRFLLLEPFIAIMIFVGFPLLVLAQFGLV